MKNKNIILLTLFASLSCSVFAQEAVIYKYKDAKGNLIYSDNVPANEKGQYSVLSGKSGVLKAVVERQLNEDEIAQAQESKAKEKQNEEKTYEQRKRDNSLLATYSSVNEITKLKSFELNQINQSIKNQIGTITDLKDKISQVNATLDKSPNNNKLKDNLNELQSKLGEANTILDSNKSLLESRTKKYQEDETRYVAILKEMSAKKTDDDSKK